MTKNQYATWLLKEKYNGIELPGFFTDCARLEAGELLAYVIGHVPFLACTIHLDSKPLIPRPETEFWTEKAIGAIHEAVANGAAAKPPCILDLCAGSGAIGVVVAKAIPEALVTFAELDPTHLSTIVKNIHANEIDPNRCTVTASDLFETVDGTFDFILSNPPYIDAAANTVEPSVTAHEPHLALFGGVAGLEVITRIIEGARAKLAPHGTLWLEHEPFQAEAIAEIAEQHSFRIVTHHDQYDTVRYSVLS